MARPVRIEYEGAFYHIISRGEKQENIFFSDTDRRKFLEKLRETVEKFIIKIHCYVLMDNHYHLLVETPRGNIVKAIHYLNTSYSNWFKIKNNIIGSVFQGRYKSILVEKENYLTVLSAYIHLNPVRSGIVKNPDDYRWSSYRSYIGKDKEVRWLTLKDVLSQFSGKKEMYPKFVSDWGQRIDKKDRERFYGKNSMLGSKWFEERVLKKVKMKLMPKDKREIPELKSLRKLSEKDMKTIIIEEFNLDEKELYKKKRMNQYRKLFIYGLKRYTDLRLKEIGEIMDMDYSAVSELVRWHLRESEKDENIKLMIQQFDEAVKKKIFI
jgi:REP element-mobilizing transposase RayT